jgi:hypothetical protein
MGLKDTVTDKEANQISVEHHEAHQPTTPGADDKDLRA